MRIRIQRLERRNGGTIMVGPTVFSVSVDGEMYMLRAGGDTVIIQKQLLHTTVLIAHRPNSVKYTKTLCVTLDEIKLSGIETILDKFIHKK